jgi:hypothetical protein
VLSPVSDCEAAPGGIVVEGRVKPRMRESGAIWGDEDDDTDPENDE